MTSGTAGPVRVSLRRDACARAAHAAPAARRFTSAPGSLVPAGSVSGPSDEAGLRVVGEGEVACPFVFASSEASWRGNASAGVNQAAIAHSGEAAVRAVYTEADRAHTRTDGTVRYENVFLRVAGERP